MRDVMRAKGGTRKGGDHKQPGHELKRGDAPLEIPISKQPYPPRTTNRVGPPPGTKKS